MKKLMLIVGASGAGKDALLGEARKYFKDDQNVSFIRRYITRKPGKYEENFYVDEIAFKILEEHGFFLIHWDAHHLKYGIPRHEIENLSNDKTGIVSISRTKIEDCEKQYLDKVITINIKADPSIIEERLRKRNRETEWDIETRLQRIGTPVTARHLVDFDNNQELEISSLAFISLLKKLINHF